MRPLLTDWLRDKRNRLAAGYARGDILDLGCGSADILRFLDSRGTYVGIDNHLGLIGWLQSRDDIPDADFHCLDLDDLDEAIQGRFDTILLVAVIEHLRRPGKLLAEVTDLLSEDGIIVITTPTPFGDLLHRCMARLGLTHKEAVRQHHNLYNKRDMIDLLSSAGLAPIERGRFELGLNQFFVCRRINRVSGQ